MAMGTIFRKEVVMVPITISWFCTLMMNQSLESPGRDTGVQDTMEETPSISATSVIWFPDNAIVRSSLKLSDISSGSFVVTRAPVLSYCLFPLASSRGTCRVRDL